MEHGNQQAEQLERDPNSGHKGDQTDQSHDGGKAMFVAVERQIHFAACFDQVGTREGRNDDQRDKKDDTNKGHQHVSRFLLGCAEAGG